LMRRRSCGGEVLEEPDRSFAMGQRILEDKREPGIRGKLLKNLKWKVMKAERALYLYGQSHLVLHGDHMFSEFIINEKGFVSTKIDAYVYRRYSTYHDSSGTRVT
jgi:hypothetical protein